jgi:hypothetical protein
MGFCSFSWLFSAFFGLEFESRLSEGILFPVFFENKCKNFLLSELSIDDFTGG